MKHLALILVLTSCGPAADSPEQTTGGETRADEPEGALVGELVVDGPTATDGDETTPEERAASQTQRDEEERDAAEAAAQARGSATPPFAYMRLRAKL